MIGKLIDEMRDFQMLLSCLSSVALKGIPVIESSGKYQFLFINRFEGFEEFNA